MDAARAAGLPPRMSVIVTEDNAREEQAMTALCEQWGVEYNVFTNMTPTIYGGAESLTAQSKDHPADAQAVHRLQRGPHLLPACPPKEPRASPASARSRTASCFAPVVAPAASSPGPAPCADPYLTRPVEAAAPPVTVITPVADPDTVMDTIKCSCNAGDDNPH
ncbi:hypothetical protein AB0K02_24085 [Streptomyces sp. NPDC049597]|uniref:hypothetical protein n=1 Tax=Streptomyces sp. NPDC049597 TaxID=3155276 RepID=UPI00344A6FB6